MGCANFIIGLFGIRRFFGEIDRDRDFLRETARGDDPTIIAAILDWAAEEGFKEFISQPEFDLATEYENAHEFRNRLLIATLRSLRKSSI